MFARSTCTCSLCNIIDLYFTTFNLSLECFGRIYFLLLPETKIIFMGKEHTECRAFREWILFLSWPATDWIDNQKASDFPWGYGKQFIIVHWPEIITPYTTTTIAFEIHVWRSLSADISHPSYSIWCHACRKIFNPSYCLYFLWIYRERKPSVLVARTLPCPSHWPSLPYRIIEGKYMQLHAIHK